MKIWKGYGSEHSANLVIIGTFKTIEDASEVKGIIEELTAVVRDDEKNGLIKAGESYNRLSESISNFVLKSNFGRFDYSDPAQLLLDYKLTQDSEKIIINTEEQSIQIFINAMLHRGGKVEVFSNHDYPSEYNRQ